jgi:hypothetical protein
MALIFVNLSRGNVARNNFAKDAITHGSMLAERFVGEQ